MGNRRLGVLLAIVVAACGCKDDEGARVKKTFAGADAEVARLQVAQLANEAYAMWSNANAGQACPSSIDELAEFGGLAKDPWGHPFVYLCGGSLPPGARVIAVFSVGPDGKGDTGDDIKSWQ